MSEYFEEIKDALQANIAIRDALDRLPGVFVQLGPDILQRLRHQ